MRPQTQLFVKRLSENATLPTRGSTEAAGLDLYAAEAMTIPPHGKGLVATDLALDVPPGHYARVAPRSGLAWKNHIDVGAGVIDSDYRGPVKVILYNHSSQETFTVSKGDRIAQLILEQISIPAVVEVQDLATSIRGEGGFGSTGK